MAGPAIQALLRGYLGFFQIKNRGQNPVELTNVVQNVLDLRDWYFASNGVPLATDSVIAVAGGFNGALVTTGAGAIAVPNNEQWYIDTFTAFSGDLAATDQISIAPAIQYEPNTGGAHLLDQGMLGAAPLVGTAAGRTVGVVARGFFAPPGAVLGIAVGECISAGMVNVSVRVRGARLAPV